jgi:2,4-didehydro-3-deoxy-L-rhamnonate hydrolase
MRLCRFDESCFGAVEGDHVADITEALEVLPSARWPFPLGDLMIANLPLILERAHALLPAAKRLPLADCRLLSPVGNPSKIMGAPLNYRDHLDESKTDSARHDHKLTTAEELGLFLKAGSSLIGPGQSILQRFPTRRSDHEAELAIIVGKQGRNIPREQARDHIGGACIGLDITVRGPEFQSLRKSPDTYCVLGPWLTTIDDCPDFGDIGFKLDVNGEPRQRSNTSYMTVPVERLIEIASSYYTLYPGDVLLTGTCSGVGPIIPGDIITTEFEGLGKMDVRVA